LVYLGFPQVGLQEICRELYNISYQDHHRACRYPYPLFFRDFTPEPDLEESKQHVVGPVTPPHPRYDVPRWREMISIVEDRVAAEGTQGGAEHEESLRAGRRAQLRRAAREGERRPEESRPPPDHRQRSDRHHDPGPSGTALFHLRVVAALQGRAGGTARSPRPDDVRRIPRPGGRGDEHRRRHDRRPGE